MIDELIPDLHDPRLRALYDALLGKREATMDEKVALVAVCMDVADSAKGDDLDSRFPNPAYAVKIACIMERAMQVDEHTFDRRLNAYIDDVNRIAKKAKHPE